MQEPVPVWQAIWEYSQLVHSRAWAWTKANAVAGWGAVIVGAIAEIGIYVAIGGDLGRPEAALLLVGPVLAMATYIAALIWIPAKHHAEQERRIDDLEGSHDDHAARLIAKRDDIDDQRNRLSNDTQAGNSSVTAGQVILDEIDGCLFAERTFEHKLRTRVSAISSRGYWWQTDESHPWSQLSVQRQVFIGYMSVKDQEPEGEFGKNPGVPQSMQRIEMGLRELVADIDNAVTRLTHRPLRR